MPKIFPAKGWDKGVRPDWSDQKGLNFLKIIDPGMFSNPVFIFPSLLQIDTHYGLVLGVCAKISPKL